MYVSVYVYIRSYVDEKTQQWTEVTLYKVIMNKNDMFIMKNKK